MTDHLNKSSMSGQRQCDGSALVSPRSGLRHAARRRSRCDRRCRLLRAEGAQPDPGAAVHCQRFAGRAIVSRRPCYSRGRSPRPLCYRACRRGDLPACQPAHRDDALEVGGVRSAVRRCGVGCNEPGDSAAYGSRSHTHHHGRAAERSHRPRALRRLAYRLLRSQSEGGGLSGLQARMAIAASCGGRFWGWVG